MTNSVRNTARNPNKHSGARRQEPVPHRQLSKKALVPARNRRFFVVQRKCLISLPALLILFSSHPCSAAAISGPSCLSRAPAHPVRIEKVIDGDTIVLSDQRIVRLIGINSPELAQEPGRTEPFARKAKLDLQRLIAEHYHHGRLLYGKQRHDRYGRLLAHLYVGKVNAQAYLLRRGLAFNLAYPPNLKMQDCYSKNQQIARDKQLGIWNTALGHSYNAAEIGNNVTGFRRITGEVQRVTTSGNNIWINMRGKRIAIQVKRRDARHFNRKLLRSLQGKHIEAQGYVFRVNRNRPQYEQLRMQIRHEDMLKVVSQ